VTQSLDKQAIAKREGWANRVGVEQYIDQMGWYALKRDEQVIGSMIGQGPGRALDMPCGSGRFLSLLKERGFAPTAADYSLHMLEEARKRHNDVNFLQADIFNPPFAADSFDLVLISRLLFHYDHPERIVQTLLPAVKAGGRLIFDTLNPYTTRHLACKLLPVHKKDPARRLYFEPQADFRRRLEAIGLEVLEHKTAYILPTRLYRKLPKPLVYALQGLERITPPAMRVLSYWHVRKLDK
jgi:SAM-dependent methyltransferase